MKKRLLISFLLISIFFNPSVLADEGMWIPVLIEKYNIKLMQEKGFKLTAEDIYSVNKASMKDAVLIFGGGCTGELISSEGLLITNHHCGYSQIQKHSSLEHDYLTNGFWAMSGKEELVCPGLTITILKWMEDVTDQVLDGVNDSMPAVERDGIIKANIMEIQVKAVQGNNYTASVRPFYMGNQYFLFVNEVFRDVRLVGAPPSAIGKFGGDTDNWVWPRHTGDFSLFRVYADKNNNPADYSKDNVPYKPAYSFPISMKGVKEGDFTMVFGYPGSTYQYVPSYYIDMVKNYINPEMIDVRGKKIEIMNERMNLDPLVRIQYSSKVATISNSWKKWIGEIKGLERMNTISEKQEYEARLTEWMSNQPGLNPEFKNILPSYKDLYDKFKDYNLAGSYLREAIYGVEAISFANSVSSLIELYEEKSPEEKIIAEKENLVRASEGFFKNYDQVIDKKLFAALMKMYGENIAPEWQYPGYIKIKKSVSGDFEEAADKIYSKTIFTDEEKYKSFIKNFSEKSVSRIKKDPLYILATDADNFLNTRIRPEYTRLYSEIQKLNKAYMTLQMEFERERIFYPDANFTLRIAFGNVAGYYSRDAVYFTHYTTLKGIIEKDNPEIYDYDVPDKLKELFNTRDFGKYTQNGEVPVCFVANNHTTGGNSGSPVINADGHLIGINFDRAWEGVASDMAYNPEQSRNISLDIRYVLFIIDKFAGAGYLLDEMVIVE